MLRTGKWNLVWILVTPLVLAALGCNRSSDERPAVTASIESGEGAATQSPSATVPVSTGAPDAAIADSSRPGQAAPRRQAVELHPLVVIKTNLGDITVELDSENTPMTVDNFIAYAEDGFYNGTVFHYVEQGYMISAGGYKASGERQRPRASLFNEARHAGKNVRGTIAMARDPQYKHSAEAQFYINLVDNEALDHQSDESDASYGYCVFGKVTEGLDVVDRIAAVPVTDDEIFVKRPVDPVVIESIERLR